MLKTLSTNPTVRPVEDFRDAHAGESFVLLGNGPSLTAWQDSLPALALKHRILGINRSWMTPAGERGYVSDYHVVFGELHGLEVAMKRYRPRTVFTNHSCAKSLIGYDGEIVTVPNLGGWDDGHWNYNLARGTAAPLGGIYALQLAAWMGAATVYLLGYDLGRGDGHHYQADGDRLNRSMYARRFTGAGHYAEHHGMKVYNANPESALRCFDFASPEA